MIQMVTRYLLALLFWLVAGAANSFADSTLTWRPDPWMYAEYGRPLLIPPPPPGDSDASLWKHIEALETDPKDEVREGVSTEELDRAACPFSVFAEGLIWSDMFLWLKEHKEKLVFMPSHEAEELERQARMQFRKEHVWKFFQGLKVLNETAKTLALVFAERTLSLKDRNDRNYTCVWLVDRSGVRASTTISDIKKPGEGNEAASIVDDDFLRGLWRDLLVETRSKGRSVRKPVANKPCEDDATVPLTTEQLSGVNAALQRVADRILSSAITDVLKAEEADRARLYVVPVRSVQKVPFAALPYRDGHLIDKFAIMTVAASSVIGRFSSSRSAEQPANTALVATAASSANTLIVGDPDLSWDRKSFCWPKLPFARAEVEAVAGATGATKLLEGKSATFQTVSSLLKAGQKSLRYIHLATHGVSDPDNPADGGFLALNDKHLSGSELRKMKLRFESEPIVVMSACHSSTGKVFAGGVFGLADFWYFAGASQVVASLWAVNDQGTSKLMSYFTSDLVSRERTGSTVRGAEYSLAAAMRKLKSEERDPTVWSSFIVIGKPLR